MGLATVFALVALLSLFTLGVGSSLAVGYVDGISDQSMPWWDYTSGQSYNWNETFFANYFGSHWVNPAPHIQYSRFVPQWNAYTRSGGEGERTDFEQWVIHAGGMGLKLDMSMTNYGHERPASMTEYKTNLRDLLNRANELGHPIQYLEPWNEPNAQGNMSAIEAAKYANEANSVCHEAAYGCAVIAANFYDRPNSVEGEVEAYRDYLNFSPTYWGVHPYESVQNMSVNPYRKFLNGLPNAGAGDHIWFTEVAAHYCLENGATTNGENGQAERAKWLVNTLINSNEAEGTRLYPPEHVFYYSFLYKNRELSNCVTNHSDDALYVPTSSDPNAQDRPRRAAAYIYGGSAIPMAFTGAATTNPGERQATFHSSVYPLENGEAHFYYEYGPTTAYGSTTPTIGAGGGLGPDVYSYTVGGLAPNTLYHYRVYAYNSHGGDFGLDHTFTLVVPPSPTTSAASGVGATGATLNGSVNPNGLDTHYYFEYGTTTGYGAAQPAPPGTGAGAGNGAVGAATTLSGLVPATTYHFRLVASSSAGTSYGADQSFTTPPAAPAVSVEAASGFQPGGLATLRGTVNPGNAPTHYRFEWGTSEAYGNKAPVPDGELAAGLSPVSLERAIGGLAGHTTYYYRLFAENSAGTGEAKGSFTTPEWKPVASTEAASGVRAKVATLNGKVNPEGFATTYNFEYGPTTAYGTKVPVPAEGIGSGSAAVSVSKAISGLEAGTTYHFRLTATNANGTALGPDQEFRTLNRPAAITEAAAYANTFEPQLNATVNPEGTDTHYQFEYGETEAYGTRLPAQAVDLGSEAKARQVSLTIGLAGLERGKPVHYRVVAENEGGLTYGADRTFTALPPCSGPEGKCAFSTQSTPNPLARTETQLTGVSCTGATSCLAVGNDRYRGKGVLESWNGSAWSLAYTLESEVKGLSCPTSSWCMAIAKSGASAWVLTSHERLPGEIIWNAEAANPPTPAGALEVALRGVSCSSTSACTAVGEWDNSSREYHTLAYRWGALGWAQQATPVPGEGSPREAMKAVSCPTEGFCAAVGTAAGKTYVSRWSGTEWVGGFGATPTSSTSAVLEGVSCASASACMATGFFHESLGQNKALAERWSGGEWSLTAVPSPAEALGPVLLRSVSCPSASACSAVGSYATKLGERGGVEEEKTLAASWNGSEWSLKPAPNPTAAKFSSLASVSCSSGAACTGVGSASPGPAGESSVTLAERWGGSEWRAESPPNVAPGTESRLEGVSCAAGGPCLAVGADLYLHKGLVEAWNGKAWSLTNTVGKELRAVSCPTATWCMAIDRVPDETVALTYVESGGQPVVRPLGETLPTPAGSSATTLESVSCSSESACTAVGRYYAETKEYRPLVERWNGSSWSLQTAPNPPEGSAQQAMLAVSCAGQSSCVAVGTAASKPLAYRWDGSSWMLTSSPPVAPGGVSQTLKAISCPATGFCMATGSYSETTGPTRPVAESWNGTSWTGYRITAPADAQGDVALNSVSCLSPGSCFAAGSYVSKVGNRWPEEEKTLAEVWSNGWTQQPTPNPAGQSFSTLLGLSCTSSVACTAVGSAQPGLGSAGETTLGERYE